MNRFGVLKWRKTNLTLVHLENCYLDIEYDIVVLYPVSVHMFHLVLLHPILVEPGQK